MPDNSLANFYKSLSERNAGRSLYAPVAQSVLSADVTDPYASTGQNFGANLIKGLLGGFAAGQFKNEQAEYGTNLTQALRGSLSGASAFGAGLPEDDVAAISAFKLAREQDQIDEFNALKMKAFGAGLSKEYEIEAEQGAYAKAAKAALGQNDVIDGIDPGLAETNPILKGKLKAVNEKKDYNTKEEDSARMELLTKTPSVNQFTVMQKSIPLVQGFKDQDTKSSDVGFVYNYIKSLDDGAVRGEEINMAESSNPLIQQYRNTFKAALENKSVKSLLTPQLKNQMYAELRTAQKKLYDQALLDSERRLSIVEQRGGNRNFASPIDLGLKFEEAAATAPPVSFKASDLIAKGYTKGANGWIPPSGGSRTKGGAPLG